MVRGELNHRAILVASGEGGRGMKGEMLKGRENMGEKGRGEGSRFSTRSVKEERQTLPQILSSVGLALFSAEVRRFLLAFWGLVDKLTYGSGGY